MPITWWATEACNGDGSAPSTCSAPARASLGAANTIGSSSRTDAFPAVTPRMVVVPGHPSHGPALYQSATRGLRLTTTASGGGHAMAPQRFHEQFDQVQRSMPDVPLAMGPDDSAEFFYEKGVVLARDGEEARLVEDTVRGHFAEATGPVADPVRRGGPETARAGRPRVRVGGPGPRRPQRRPRRRPRAAGDARARGT